MYGLVLEVMFCDSIQKLYIKKKTKKQKVTILKGRKKNIHSIKII